jgi:hypothetical protein
MYLYARKITLALLDPVHNAAIRICTGAYGTSPSISLHADSGEPPLYLRRAQLTLQMIARLKQLPLSLTWLTVMTEYYGALFTAAQVQQMQVMPVTFEDSPNGRIPISTFCPDQNFPL